MKKLLFLFFFCSLFMETSAQWIDDMYQIQLQQCTSNDLGDLRHSEHRTSPQIPNVYYEKSTSIVYFENPCYDCSLELLIPGTNSIAYTYSITDGDDSVNLSNVLSGEYEIHIHLGEFCFWGNLNCITHSELIIDN